VRHRWRLVAVLVGGLVAFSALANLVEHLTPKPHGPRSSSYATSPAGLAAYASLLADYGHAVRRVRRPPSERPLDPRSTAVLLDPGVVESDDAAALRVFLLRGGRLVVVVESSDVWLQDVLRDAPEWSELSVNRARPIVPVAETAGVENVESAGPGSWTTQTGQAVPVIAGDGGSVVAVATVGRGRAVLLADPSPLQNRLLGHADNAVLGLALAGPRNRTVDFLESVHGYRPASGFSAVPWSWRFALGGLVVAALVLMLARGRRLGPPEAEDRELPPPRRVYVESLAAVLGRTRRPDEAIETVRAEGKRLLAERGQLEEAQNDDALKEVGRRAGLSDTELGALLGAVRGKAGVLAAGRALAKLESAEGRTQ
jgi:Domain of unknown function (DUF4350)